MLAQMFADPTKRGRTVGTYDRDMGPRQRHVVLATTLLVAAGCGDDTDRPSPESTGAAEDSDAVMTALNTFTLRYDDDQNRRYHHEPDNNGEPGTGGQVTIVWPFGFTAVASPEHVGGAVGCRRATSSRTPAPATKTDDSRSRNTGKKLWPCGVDPAADEIGVRADTEGCRKAPNEVGDASTERGGGFNDHRLWPRCQPPPTLSVNPTDRPEGTRSRTMSLQLTSQQVWENVEKNNFAVLGMVTAKGEPRTVGIVYIVDDHKLYIGAERTAWKVKHIERNPRVSVTAAIPKRVPLMPWIKIPAATITFSGTAKILEKQDVGGELLEKLYRHDEGRDGWCAIEVTPTKDFITYGVGVSLLTMRSPEKSRSRAPVATR